MKLMEIVRRVKNISSAYGVIFPNKSYDSVLFSGNCQGGGRGSFYLWNTTGSLAIFLYHFIGLFNFFL
jgi:hypothetical protein